MDRTRTLDRDELEKFVASLGKQQCAIPDELVRHYLAHAGFVTKDVRLERLIALAAQKFLADIANDTIGHSRLRTQSIPSTKKKVPTDTRIVLTIDDLERALREYGVPFRKPPYFADSVSAGAPDPAPTAAGAAAAAGAGTGAPKTAKGAIAKPAKTGMGKAGMPKAGMPKAPTKQGGAKPGKS